MCVCVKLQALVYDIFPSRRRVLGERECVCVCVCVRERDRERERICVFVCERERESMKTVCPYLFVFLLIRTVKLITQCDGSQ